ncbi:hypothetical protein PG291_01505 [Riemerella anatipestifer]|nr:hypothetical protein [Riemerella anatipestifer]
MIKDWIEDYQPKTVEDYKQALREIMQQLVLAGREVVFSQKVLFMAERL